MIPLYCIDITKSHSYQHHYDSQLPVLDLRSPDNLYDLSPLLFWTVTFIGSRKYDKFPTLTLGLSSRVNKQISWAVTSRNVTIHTVKALMIYLTWPYTSTLVQKSSSFVLSASLIHMAIQCGLHIPHMDIESSRLCHGPPPLPTIEKAKLWAYTVITYHR
jgi:hypothetical protein